MTERGAELPGQGQLPLAPVLHADHTVALIMVIALFAGFGAAVVWALVKLIRDREVLAPVLLVAGVIAANIEPVGDHVGMIVYAPNIPWFDFWELGRQMPSFIAIGLASYVACGSYYTARLIEQGRSLRELAFVSAVLVGIPEIIMELVWSHWHIIAYYGDNPTRIGGIPLYSIVQNSTLLPVFGVVCFLGKKYLHGWQILWMLIFVPTTTIGYVVGVSWPVYQAVGSSAPHIVTWIACAATITGSIGVTWAALNFPDVRALREARAAERQQTLVAA